jgi:cobalt-zinc-cadmium efflux system outer membrane protein
LLIYAPNGFGPLGLFLYVNGEIKVKLLNIFILLLLTNAAIAQEASYEALLKTLEKHPSLEAMHQQVIAQKEASLGSAGLPDPMLMLGINNYPADGSGGFDRFAMTSKSIGFVQKIPNGSVRASTVLAKRHLATKASIAKDFGYAQLVAQLNTALAQRYSIAQQQAFLHEEVKLLKQESAYWEGRLTSGDSALDERSRVVATLAQVEAKLATLKARKEAVEAQLVRLVEEVPNITVPKQTPQVWPNSGEIFPVKLAQADVQVAQAEVQGAKSAFYPNYQLGITYAQRDNTGAFDGGDFISAQVGVSVPLWASKNQAPKLRSAKAKLKQAEAQLLDVELLWQQKIKTQTAQIKEIEQTLKVFMAKENAIRTQISSLKNAYAADGRLDVLISAKRSLLQLKVQVAQLKARYVAQVSQFNSIFSNSLKLLKGN